MDWNENEHPRDKIGQFTDKENGNRVKTQLPINACAAAGITLPSDITEEKAWEMLKEKTGLTPDKVKEELNKQEERENAGETPEEIEKLYGEEFKGYKGQAAIDKLLKEQRGHVKGAFHRDDMGDIDLVWGSDTVGLQHIIKQRERQGIDISTFLGGLSDVVENGRFIQKNGNGTFEFWREGKMAVITPEYHGQRVTFLLTAYKRTKPPRV